MAERRNSLQEDRRTFHRWQREYRQHHGILHPPQFYTREHYEKHAGCVCRAFETQKEDSNGA